MNNKRECFHISFQELRKYILCAREELAFRLKENRFTLIKDMNPFLKKHFGFTYSFDKHQDSNKVHKIEIYNKPKFLFFIIKYEL